MRRRFAPLVQMPAQNIFATFSKRSTARPQIILLSTERSPKVDYKKRSYPKSS